MLGHALATLVVLRDLQATGNGRQPQGGPDTASAVSEKLPSVAVIVKMPPSNEVSVKSPVASMLPPLADQLGDTGKALLYWSWPGELH